MPSFSSFRRSRNIGSARSKGPLSSEPELPLWSSIAEPVYASSISARSICSIEKDNRLNRLKLGITLIAFGVKEFQKQTSGAALFWIVAKLLPMRVPELLSTFSNATTNTG
jgi:hypothetical protein